MQRLSTPEEVQAEVFRRWPGRFAEAMKDGDEFIVGIPDYEGVVGRSREGFREALEEAAKGMPATRFEIYGEMGDVPPGHTWFAHANGGVAPSVPVVAIEPAIEPTRRRTFTITKVSPQKGDMVALLVEFPKDYDGVRPKQLAVKA